MLEVKNLTKRYGRKLILNDVSMNFKKGEITCLLGLNGVGKSTVMKAIMRLIPVNQGTFTIDGEKITSKNMNRLAYVPDVQSYNLSFTVDKNLKIACLLYPGFDMEKADRLISFFKLSRKKRLNELSKGNLTRFNLLVGLCQ